jgi:excisionase family DNA binding protein
MHEVKLLRVSEVARRLGVCVRTVRNYIGRGMLRVVRLGRAVRVDERDLEAFVSSLRGNVNA